MSDTKDINKPLRNPRQAPVDGKTYINTLQELKEIETNFSKGFEYFENLEIFCNEDGNIYIWKDVNLEKELNETLLISNYIYPNNIIYNNIDYSNRSFNFFKSNSNLELNKEKKALHSSDFLTGDTAFIVNSNNFIISNLQTTVDNITVSANKEITIGEGVCYTNNGRFHLKEFTQELEENDTFIIYIDVEGNLLINSNVDLNIPTNVYLFSVTTDAVKVLDIIDLRQYDNYTNTLNGKVLVPEATDPTQVINKNQLETFAATKDEIIVEQLRITSLESAAASNAVIYSTYSDANAVNPRPTDGTRFEISELTDPLNAGIYAFTSITSEYPDGIRFEGKKIKTTNIISPSNEAVSSEALYNLNETNKEKFCSKKLAVKQSVLDDGEDYITIDGTSKLLGEVDATYIEVDNAFNFSGTQRIIIQKGLDFRTGGTLFFRCRVGEADGNDRIISNGRGFNPTTDRAFFIVPVRFSSGESFFSIQVGADNVSCADIGYNIVNRWVDVLIDQSSTGEITWFIDGIEIPTNGSNNANTIFTSRDFVIGNLDNNGVYNRPMNGDLQKVIVFERQLNSAEKIQIRNQELDLSDAKINVNFNLIEEGKRDALYFKDSNDIDRYREFFEGSSIKRQVLNGDIWLDIDSADQKENLIGNKVLVKSQNIVESNASINIDGISQEVSTINATYLPNDNAFNFSGEERIEINKGLNFTGGGSLAIKFRAGEADGNDRLVSNGVGFNPTSSNAFWILPQSFSNNTDNSFAIQIGGSTVISGQLGFNPIGQWVDLVVNFATNGNITFYVNGIDVGINGGNTTSVINTSNPFIIGNLNNNGTFNRPLNGDIRQVHVFQRELNSTEIIAFTNNNLVTTNARISVNFANVSTTKRDALYFENELGEEAYREYFESGEKKRQVLNGNTWENVTTENNEGNDIELKATVKQDISNRYNIASATDGWGTGIVPCDIQPITANDYEYINTGVDLSTSVGEAFHGLSEAGEWLVQAPQDHHSAVFYNTITKEVREVDLSSYTRAIPAGGDSYRDKFNGITSTHGGKYVWLAPSWTTHLVQINTETFTIENDWLVNSNRNDAYNGIVSTRKYIWLITHSKEDLPRINIETGQLDFFTLTEPSIGDYSMQHADVAQNRSFLGGSDNGDGTIWLHPRRSKHFVKIDEETGTVLKSIPHALANETEPTFGYFHGCSNVNGIIWCSPFGFEEIVWFNTINETTGRIPVSLSGTTQWNFSSVSDGRFIWMPPFRSRQLIKIDTLDNSIHIIDATLMVNSFIAGRVRSSTPSEGFAGGAVVKDKNIWFSSSFESCYIKLPIREYGKEDIRSQKNLMARESVISGNGEFYFNSNIRLKLNGTDLLKQQKINNVWTTIATI